jgi:uncharacterized protein with beta-barrel porin domain
MTTELDITCARGDTASWTITYAVDGNEVNLTGAKLWMTGRRNKGGAVVFQRTSTPAAGITINPDQVTYPGKAVVKLATASTSGLPSENVSLFYDIQVLTAAGDIDTIARGTLLVTPDSTLDVA